MKIAMNGGLIIGSRGPTNKEIEKEIGSNCIFLFGADTYKFFTY
jgi:glucan phosphorylase